MKQPTLKEVKEHFKNAKKVKSYFGSTFKYKGAQKGYCDNTFMHKGKTNHTLWSPEKGYAEILTYKEKTFSITQSQIKEVNEFFLMHNSKESSYKLKEWFPEAFESDFKLDVGVWYVDKFKRLFVPTKIIDQKNCLAYGFGCIHNNFISESTKGEWEINGSERKATVQEVFEALRAESLKRYKVGQLFYLDQQHDEIGYLKMDEDGFKYYPKENQLFVGAEKNRRAEVFYQGIWREEIESITLSEAEQQLRKKIIV